MLNILFEATVLCSKLRCEINAPIVLLEYLSNFKQDQSCVLIVLLKNLDPFSFVWLQKVYCRASLRQSLRDCVIRSM